MKELSGVRYYADRPSCHRGAACDYAVDAYIGDDEKHRLFIKYVKSNLYLCGFLNVRDV